MVISFAYDVQVDHSNLCTFYSSHIYLAALDVSNNHQRPYALVWGEIFFVHLYCQLLIFILSFI